MRGYVLLPDRLAPLRGAQVLRGGGNGAALARSDTMCFYALLIEPDDLVSGSEEPELYLVGPFAGGWRNRLVAPEWLLGLSVPLSPDSTHLLAWAAEVPGVDRPDPPVYARVGAEAQGDAVALRLLDPEEASPNAVDHDKPWWRVREWRRAASKKHAEFERAQEEERRKRRWRR